MMQPMVSVVTPVYKVEPYIEECVRSVLNQTYSNIEYILTDDCGGDRSIEIAEGLLNAQNHISYRIIHHEQNEGVSAARNHAMKATTGEYIFCLDSDDCLEPECIERLVQRMQETDADFVCCGHYSDGEADSRGGHLCAPVPLAEDNATCIKAFAQGWFNVAPWCKLLKRAFIEKYNLYFKEGIINEDNPWTFMLCLSAKRIAFLNEALYYYRYNDISIMSSSKSKVILKANKIGLDIYYEEIVKHPNLCGNKYVYQLFMFQLVRYYTLCYELLSNRSEFSQCVKDYNNYTFKSHFFSPLCSDIPKYHRLWNVAFKIPFCLQPTYLWFIIAMQKSLGRGR